MKKAIGYLRVSTKGQAETDEYGFDIQRNAIEEYAQENGYEIVEWKSDVGSGASDDREAFNELLYGEVYNPPVEAVIVFKSDRVARDIKLYFYYLYVLERKKIKLISTVEEFEEQGDFANVYRAILQFVAEQERRNIALRTGRGRLLKAVCGGYAGGRAPYGYKAVDGRLTIVPEEVELVKLVFELKAQGMPNLVIADELHDRGYRTRKGTRIRDTLVRGIVEKRKLYEGYYKYGKGAEWVEGVHEPIFKQEV